MLVINVAKMKILVVILLICVLNTTVKALTCYICSVGENDVDKRCVTEPAQVNTINCNKNYCTTMRVEYLNPKGKVASMNRDCLDKPQFLNEIQEDGSHRIYYTACQTDLCNGGTGKDTSQGQLIGDIGEEIVLLVPGIGVNTAATFSSSIFLISTFVLVFNAYY